jgi:hypothetical protein
VALAAEAGDTQDAGDGALAESPDSLGEQDLGMASGPVAKQRRNAKLIAAKRVGRCGMAVSLGGDTPAYRIVRFAASDALIIGPVRWPKSS